MWKPTKMDNGYLKNEININDWFKLLGLILANEHEQREISGGKRVCTVSRIQNKRGVGYQNEPLCVLAIWIGPK